ncbi:MAG: hypothetical protein ACJAXM_001340 [Arenicella sp.]|jgi:hypothetical protein
MQGCVSSKRVRLTLGLGTSAAKRAIKSSGSTITKDHMTAPVTGGAVAVGCFELETNLAVSRYCQPFF